MRYTRLNLSITFLYLMIASMIPPLKAYADAACFIGPCVGAGSIDDLDKFRMPYPYELPLPNIRPADIVGMGLNEENNFILVRFVGADSKFC